MTGDLPLTPGRYGVNSRIDPMIDRGIRCVDPTCPDYGDRDFGEGTCPEDHAPSAPPRAVCVDPDCVGFNMPPGENDPCPTGPKVADDEFGLYPDVDQADDPWAGRPIAKGTFRQRWLLGPRFIARRRIPRVRYHEAVLQIDLRSWLFGFESWPNGAGGRVQFGPIRINVSEPPF